MAERTGDKLLARASYHRAIDLGAQEVVNSYLADRPSENRAWTSYTEAYRDAIPHLRAAQDAGEAIYCEECGRKLTFGEA